MTTEENNNLPSVDSCLLSDDTIIPKLIIHAAVLEKSTKLECGPMPNLMVALPNIGGALYSTPQSLADAHYYMPYSNAAKTRNQLKFGGAPQTNEMISAASRQLSSPYCGDIWRTHCCLTSFFPIVDTCLSCEDIA